MKSRRRSAWQPLAPRCTSEMNSARNCRVLVAINMLEIHRSSRIKYAQNPCRHDDMRAIPPAGRAVYSQIAARAPTHRTAKSPGVARGSRSPNAEKVAGLVPAELEVQAGLRNALA